MEKEIKLNKIISNIEYLEEKKRETSEEIKAVYSEARSMGYNTKIIREVIKLKRMDINEKQEHETLLNAYLEELGIK